ncbi:MAG: glycosyltransferase [Desulfurococcales archaeon]|nr:glycosyltransferase [Desulfurococcales archaeon]
MGKKKDQCKRVIVYNKVLNVVTVYGYIAFNYVVVLTGMLGRIMARKLEKPTVAVISYILWKHPRAIRISKTLAKKGFKVIPWGSRKPLQKGPRVLRGLLNYLFALIEILTVKADIYWIESGPDVLYLFFPILRRRYVYDRRSPWSKQLAIELSIPRVIIRFAEAVERFVIKHASIIVTTNKPLTLEYNYSGKELVVIPNYPEKSFVCQGSSSLRRELNVSEVKPVFIFVGKLSKVEGSMLLPRIALSLKDAGGELWIVGDGPSRRLVEELTRKYDHVRWFGWVDRKEVPKYISSADYALVPRIENISSIFHNHEDVLKIGEYNRCRKPIIASGLAPSLYYLLLNSRDIPKFISDLCNKRATLDVPPSLPAWEDSSEQMIEYVIDRLSRG